MRIVMIMKISIEKGMLSQSVIGTKKKLKQQHQALKMRHGVGY